MLTYMVERDWREAYSRESIRMTLNLEYLKYLTGYFMAYNAIAVLGAIAVAISVITIVGWLLVIPLVTFYLLFFSAVFMGGIYQELEQKR
jgi:fatty acid desaturase